MIKKQYICQHSYCLCLLCCLVCYLALAAHVQRQRENKKAKHRAVTVSGNTPYVYIQVVFFINKSSWLGHQYIAVFLPLVYLCNTEKGCSMNQTIPNTAHSQLSNTPDHAVIIFSEQCGSFWLSSAPSLSLNIPLAGAKRPEPEKDSGKWGSTLRFSNLSACNYILSKTCPCSLSLSPKKWSPGIR